MVEVTELQVTKSSLLAISVDEHLDTKTWLTRNHLNGSGNESELMSDVSKTHDPYTLHDCFSNTPFSYSVHVVCLLRIRVK